MNRRTIAVLLAAWSVTITAGAQSPKAVITGPKEAAVGDLVILDASQSTGLSYAWALLGSTKTYLPVDNGVRVVFASGSPGEYVFALVAAGTNNNGGAAADVATWSVTIGGGTAPPNPPTPPAPSPNPPTPPGPGGKIFAVLVEQREQRGDLPLEQLQAILSPEAHAYAREHGHEYRVVDADAVDGDGNPPADVASYLSRAKGQPLPWLIISDAAGKILHESAAPGTAAELLQILKRFGGD